MTRFLLIIFIIMFCYKQLPVGIITCQVLPDDYFLLLEESQIEPDEQKKLKLVEDDMMYPSLLSIFTFSRFLFKVSLLHYPKPLSGYPILLFPPPNLR